MPEFRNEPITSFTNAANRESFARALDTVRRRFGSEHPLMIEGKPVKSEAWIDSYNPSNPREIVGRAGAASPADADHAVAAAGRAARRWRAVQTAQRAAILHRVADAAREQRFRLAALITLEAGKPWREADADVAEAIDCLDYYAYLAEHIVTHGRRRDLPGEDNHVTYEPKGVCAVLGTWSFPLALLTNMTAAALVTGNSVVMKPASATPIIAAELVRLFRDAGLPEGVLNYLPGAGERIGAHLVRHADVNVIALTGSWQTGTQIMRQASDTPATQQHVKKVLAELGGKNAIVIDSDADIDEAVGGVIASAFGYSGQKCTACSRAIVLADVYEVFCERLVEAASQLPIGPADDPATVIGPIIDAESKRRIEGHMETGRREGRVILESTPNIPGGGEYVAPTIIADVAPDAAVAQEEVFGPVLAVLKATDFDNALDIANGTRYALTAGVYSRSPRHIERAKRDLLVGNLYINRKITGSRVDIEPFGGLKMSGDGAKAGGPEYLHEFWNTRTITEHTLRHGLAPAQEMQTKA